MNIFSSLKRSERGGDVSAIGRDGECFQSDIDTGTRAGHDLRRKGGGTIDITAA